jgi:hypothetical protein
MLDFFRDPIWQFVGAVLGAIAIGVALWLRPRRSVSYDVISSNLLRIDVNENLQKKTKVLYDGKRVNNVTMFVIKISNSGNRPILTTDYIEPITIWFSEKARILELWMETKPDTLRAGFKLDDQSVGIEPVMLNAGDSVEVAALIKDYSHWGMDGRVVGVKDFTELGVSQRFSNTRVPFLTLSDIAIIVAPIFIGVLLLFKLQQLSPADLALMVELALIMVTFTGLRLIIRGPLLRQRLAIKHDKRLSSSERNIPSD